MYAFLAHEDRGAVTTDWVVLTAGIIMLGIFVAYSVLGNSQAYLIEAFDNLNQEIEDGNAELASIAQGIDFNK